MRKRLQILLIGDSGVGKSSLLQRFVYDTFLDTQPTTGEAGPAAEPIRSERVQCMVQAGGMDLPAVGADRLVQRMIAEPECKPKRP